MDVRYEGYKQGVSSGIKKFVWARVADEQPGRAQASHGDGPPAKKRARHVRRPGRGGSAATIV